MAEFGRVDVLINNAGVGTAVPATRETPEQFRNVLDVNLHGTYWMAQACGRVMKPGSLIVNISSVLGLSTGRRPAAGRLQRLQGRDGPDPRPCPAVGRPQGDPGQRPGARLPADDRRVGARYLDGLLPRIILGRLGDAAELAATAVWLASAAGGYVTGQTIVVDGGLTIT